MRRDGQRSIANQCTAGQSNCSLASCPTIKDYPKDISLLCQVIDTFERVSTLSKVSAVTNWLLLTRLLYPVYHINTHLDHRNKIPKEVWISNNQIKPLQVWFHKKGIHFNCHTILRALLWISARDYVKFQAHDRFKFKLTRSRQLT